MSPRRLLAAVRRRLAQESGYVMVTVMLLLLAGSLFAVASWAQANGDTSQTRSDYDRKQALNAAEAGLNWYMYHLNQDNSYWTYCDHPPNAAANLPLMQPWNGTSPRPWRNVVPGDPSQFVDELVPANGKTSCVQGDPTTMIDSTTGTLQIKATGQSRTQRRTLVATLRRKGFLDFLYFTNFETQDPVIFTYSDPTYANWAQSNCMTYRWAGRSTSCKLIVFGDADTIQGPFHSNDNVAACGSPHFGRTANDRIEMGGTPAVVAGSSTCTASPVFYSGQPKAPEPILPLPPTNQELANIADPQYTFSGRKYITVNNNTITVADNQARTLNVQTLPWPANGVIYDKTSTTQPAANCQYDVQEKYTNDPGCADIFIKGSYSGALTVAAENDIVVDGSLLKSGTGMMGLAANNFVRVYHPVDRTHCSSSAGNLAGSLSNPEIDAAILSLNHSFIVDNYDCGTPLGTLTVMGAIAQNFRGPVGAGNSTGLTSGYNKNYSYDDRFKNQNPPYFLAPTETQWNLVRVTEQIPAS